MKSVQNVMSQDYGKAFYLIPFLVFITLLKLRNSESFGYIFEVLPILGRTLPYFCLTVLVVGVYVYRGGRLTAIGLCWPKGHENKFKKVISILVWAVVILVMRIVVAVVLDPILESFPEHPSKTKMHQLNEDFGLLVILLPIMWIMVLGEEVLMRGFLIHYIVRVFGGTGMGWFLAILISSLVFGLFHAGKGPVAMINSGCAGLVFGLGYFLRKNLWPVIVAHCAGNTLGFLGAYLGDDD